MMRKATPALLMVCACIRATATFFKHNDVEDCAKQLERAQALIEKQGAGGILVITEGVFGMAGDQGKLREIIALKEAYNFRILVDDAHGFGTLGKNRRRCR
jgi:glycine C-acetyltransferase